MIAAITDNRTRLLPTPTASDTKNCTHRTQAGGPSLPDQILTLLPTPTAHDGASNGLSAPYRQGGPTLLDRVRHLPTRRTTGPAVTGCGAGTGEPPPQPVTALLPTPRASDGTKGCPAQRGSKGDLMLPSAIMQVLDTPTGTQWTPACRAVLPVIDGEPTPARSQHNGHLPGPDPGSTSPGDRSVVAWGVYEPAIRRWETILGRPIPHPAQRGRHGGPVLSALFVEHMMGYPLGWISAVGLPRTAQLRALGNTVVPQQAAHAVRLLLAELHALLPHYPTGHGRAVQATTSDTTLGADIKADIQLARKVMSP